MFSKSTQNSAHLRLWTKERCLIYVRNQPKKSQLCFTSITINFSLFLCLYLFRRCDFRFSAGDVRIRTDEITDETDDENRCIDFLMLASLQLILLVGIHSLPLTLRIRQQNKKVISEKKYVLKMLHSLASNSLPIQHSRCSIYSLKHVFFANGAENIFIRSKCLRNLYLFQVLRLSLVDSKLATDDSYRQQTDIETNVDEDFDTSLSDIVTRLKRVSKCLNLYPLHAACHDIDKPITTRFPCACVITMLINSGINVNTKNSLGTLVKL